MKQVVTILALGAAGPALAGNVALDSAVFVEQVETSSDGRPVTRLAPPRALRAGDRLLFVLSYANRGAKPASGFVVTNPVPDGVAFAGAEGDVEVSTDGGRTWQSPAASNMPGQVTHIRWRVRELVEAGATGKLSYRAVAR